MKIATWNVNSILARMPLVLRWLDDIKPDVLCMQETKCTDDKFPALVFQERGYQCQLFGQQSYNGVAILSRLPFLAKDPQNWCSKSDSRHGRVVLSGDLDLQNFYVPAGGFLRAQGLGEGLVVGVARADRRSTA